VAHRRTPCWFGVIAYHLWPRPTKPPTQRSSIIPSRIVVCHYHKGGRRDSTIVLVVARVEGIGPVLPILEGGCCTCPFDSVLHRLRWQHIFFCWGREVIIYTLPPTPLHCLTYPTGIPVLCPMGLTTQQSHCLYAICLHFLPPPAQLSLVQSCCQIGVQKVHPMEKV
jgi:hypothetical protein